MDMALDEKMILHLNKARRIKKRMNILHRFSIAKGVGNWIVAPEKRLTP